MMSLPLCRASSKMSIMPSGATQRSDTKVLLSLKRNTPGGSPFERRHVCPSQRVHSKRQPKKISSAGRAQPTPTIAQCSGGGGLPPSLQMQAAVLELDV